MSELNPILQQKLLERYLKLVEANHKANDYALERNRQLDDVKREQKRLSSLLKTERANLRERSKELEQSNALLMEERELRAQIELDHQKSADYIEELEKVNLKSVEELNARIFDLRSLQEKFDLQASEIQNLSEYIGILEARSEEQIQEIHKLGEYVNLLELRSDSQQNVIDKLKEECETAQGEHKKLIELSNKHDQLVQFSKQLETEKAGLLDELSYRREQSAQHLTQIKHLTSEHSKLMECLKNQKQQIERHVKDGENLRNELERLQNHRIALEESNQIVSSELERMQELHRQERAEHSKLVETISALELEVTVLKTERQDFLDQRDRLRGELNAIQSRLIYRIYKGIKKSFGGRG
tara:strand:+ start:2830 stop:3903 length:1074 start_codon:yes stop_codon:yes gene_type:complete